MSYLRWIILFSRNKNSSKRLKKDLRKGLKIQIIGTIWIQTMSVPIICDLLIMKKISKGSRGATSPSALVAPEHRLMTKTLFYVDLLHLAGCIVINGNYKIIRIIPNMMDTYPQAPIKIKHKHLRSLHHSFTQALYSRFHCSIRKVNAQIVAARFFSV